jgi:DNA-binding transcriptional regulator YhcF (GntR family)
VTPGSVPEIVSYVVDRLASGLYPPGCRLPTSRELAAELGVHRNTVAKAYKSLAELGLIATTPGRGTFAAARVEPDNRRLHGQHVRDRLADAVLRARRANLDEAELRRLIDEEIDAIYRRVPRGAFVECNPEDLRVALAEIEQQSEARLAPVLLDALAADPEAIASGFDVVFTSLFHLLEVRDLLTSVEPRRPVVGIHTQPDERALAEIAQIAPHARVGVVVSNVEGARRFEAQLHTFTRAMTRVLIKPSDDEIRELADAVDLIVTSRSRAAQLRRLQLTLPLIELSFHISPESAHRVVDALYSAADAPDPSTDPHPRPLSLREGRGVGGEGS